MPLIVFEGLDGSGKSTLMSKLEQRLKKASLNVVRTREPGGTPLGDEIRNLILRKDGQVPSALTELLLYEASRAQHVDYFIRPHLEQDFWVLCDRFTASSLAFQGGGRAISKEQVDWLNHFATQNLKVDLTVLLDLSEEQSRLRRQKRATQTGEIEDRIESEDISFHERVRQSFLEQAKKSTHENPWLVLNAEESIDQLDLNLWDAINGKFI
jgi:dTMP kinase